MSPSHVGIVVLPDVRGLYRFYEELALRFAERGHTAVAIDYFGRTAGAAKARRRTSSTWSTSRQTTPAQIQADVAAAIAWLRSPAGGSCEPLFTVGFCFGGRHSWLAAASHDLAGAIGFYGMPGERNGQPGPTQLASELRAPVLALQAGDDQNITSEHNAAFDQALTDAGVEHEIVIYDGTPHSFFDRKYEEFATASARRLGTSAQVHRHRGGTSRRPLGIGRCRSWGRSSLRAHKPSRSVLLSNLTTGKRAA